MIKLDEKQALAAVSGLQVPSKPDLLSRLQDEMSVEEPDIENIATLISQDVGLSSAILKVINSPFYGMNRRISEIKQAVMMLGLNTISSLVTAILVREAISGDSCISLERFWDDALDVANAMTYIGNKVKNKVPVDMLYTIGLLHKCGIPLLSIKYSDYKNILISANQQNINSIELEEDAYNTNHAVVGYFVASSWHLPKEICQLILQQYQPSYLSDTSDDQAQVTYSVLKAAENIVEKAKRFNSAPDWEDIETDVLTILNVSELDYQDMVEDFENML